MKKTKQLKLQASSISRVMKCPGSMTLESKLPDKYRYFAFKDAAEFGTLCHAWGENMLLRTAPKKEIADRAFNHPRFDDIRYIGETYAAAVLARKPKGGKLFVEEKFRATIHGVDCVAKSDAFYVTKDKIIKFDLKSGNFDYAESAEKQMAYAASLWCYINDGLDDGRICSMVTIQPAFYNEARRVVLSGGFPYFRSEFSDFVQRIKSRQKEFNPGSHCKMCAAVLTCEKVKDTIEEFFDMAKKATKDDLNFKEIYAKKDAVIAFFDALDAYLKTELESGKRIPGMFLSESHGHRRWINADEVSAKLAYLKEKIYKPRELKTPAQMERIAGKENIAGLYDTPTLKKVAIRENTFDAFAE